MLLYISLILLQVFSVLTQECNSPFQQCGGLGFQGPTCCTSGYECIKYNDYFSQCTEASSIDMGSVSNAVNDSIIKDSVSNNDNNENLNMNSSSDNNNSTIINNNINSESISNDNDKEYKVPEGFASMNGGTTGGQGGKVIIVSNEAELDSAAALKEPAVIIIDGAITLTHDILISSNKSIIGADENAGITGAGFNMQHVENIIIQNIKFSFCLGSTKDCINGSYATNIWIDHCELFSDLDHGKDYYDGLIDFNHASDYITVSWCYIHDHHKTSLIGSSDRNGKEDTGKLHITFHHDYFKNLNARVPSIRFGTLHVYNCVYDGIIQNGINVRMGAEGLVESNVFINSRRPLSTDLFSSGEGYAIERNNDFGSLADTVTITQVGTFETAPYPCVIDDVNKIYEPVTSKAGLVKRNFKNDYLN